MAEIVKVLFPGIISFVFGISITPIVLTQLYKYRVYRKRTSTKDILLKDEKHQEVSQVVNKTERDVSTPRMGGLVIIFAVFFTAIIFWLISLGFFGHVSGQIDFISRSQTWVPLATFALGFFLGLVDDYFTIKNTGNFKNGLPLFYRITFVLIIAIFLGWWLSAKLGITAISIPFLGEFSLGLLFIPFFVVVFLAVFGTSNIDGLDGLSGGLLSIAYTALGVISFIQDRFNIAALCFVLVGAILAFLWSNISPAKFYMGEVGYNALSFTLVVLAFLTDTVFLLPLIAFMLFINLVATVLQVVALRVFKRRVFRAAPLHHHFELLGWSEQQIVVRYWLISIIMAIFGIVLSMII